MAEKKKISISIVVLILVALLSGLIGTQLVKHAPMELNSYKHKYDSLSRHTVMQQNVIADNAKSKDSAREAMSQLKYDAVQLGQKMRLREESFRKKEQEYREQLKGMTTSELAQEARDIYVAAHPAPLFDTTDLGEPVSIERNPAIHLIEESARAQNLDLEIKDLKDMDTIRSKQLLNAEHQLRKYESDSVAYTSIISAQSETMHLQEEEGRVKDKVHRKELRRQKRQKAVAIVIAVAAVLAGIAL